MKPLLALLLFLSLNISTFADKPLNMGAPAPSASALDQDGNRVSLNQFYTNGMTLVYFYPKADTPGCTAQSCSLRDAYQKLQGKGVQVVGVSADTPQAQKAFIKKYQLPFTLLSDTGGEVMEAFKVPRSPKGFASRQAFLIRDGKIVWMDLSASTDKQADDVLDFLNNSSSPGETKTP